MKILLLGSGGREHALAWKISQSSQLEKLFVAPGNAGTNSIAENVELSVDDFKSIANFMLHNKVNILVVGPENPLVNGIHDYFDSRPDLTHITVVGPKKEGAQLEGSKDFSKSFMKRHRIPTAKYGSFNYDTLDKGLAYLEKLSGPYVLKADGLAAGKGVIIESDLLKAKNYLDYLIKTEQAKKSNK